LDISVVLATFRRHELLAGTLESLCAVCTDGLAWEALVVDNADDAETRAIAETFCDRLPLRLLVEPRRGQNHARNRGIAEARGSLVVLTDDDVTPQPDWLLELWRGAGRWPEARAFGGRVLPLWPDGEAPTTGVPFFAHAYAIAAWDQPEGPYTAHRVFGPNMAFRGSIFQAGWRFDPRIGPDGSKTYMTGSETNFALGLERAGFAPVYLPGAVVKHRIRREQLPLAWLYGRAFRMGRWQAYLRGLSQRSSRLPVGLLRDLVRTYVRFAGARVRGDAHARLTSGLAYWQVRGALWQWRQGW
jgi:glucosyl-dolichyl phosphate glucuronosyltransferase